MRGARRWTAVLVAEQGWLRDQGALQQLMGMWSTAGGVVRRDRAIVAAGLIGITLIGWAYLYHDASTMHCERMAMPNTAPWNAGEFGLMFIMWTIMMIAMMIPSASPMLLSFATVNRRRLERDAP